MSAGAGLLEVRSIGMRFGGVAALDDVTFWARAGEVLGVLGPNGAGKTTLFNVISGLQAPTSGAVTLDGVRITGRSSERIAALGLTRTFQTPVMFWGLSVRESISLALDAGERSGTFPPLFLRALLPSALGLRKTADRASAARAAEALERSPLAALADRPTESLSFGEERLLEMARALAAGPKVLLLDEPLSGLNAGEAEEVLQQVLIARERGVAVLLVEHAVDELFSVADRVVVLDHGKKIAEGTCADVAADRAVIDAYLGAEI